jgi:hypothetical protein
MLSSISSSHLFIWSTSSSADTTSTSWRCGTALRDFSANRPCPAHTYSKVDDADADYDDGFVHSRSMVTIDRFSTVDKTREPSSWVRYCIYLITSHPFIYFIISSPHIFIYLIVSIDSFLILLIFQVFTYALYHFFWLFLNVSMFWMKSSHRGFNRLISATHPISIDILITRLIRKFCNLQYIDIIIIITHAFSEFSDKARVTK